MDVSYKVTTVRAPRQQTVVHDDLDLDQYANILFTILDLDIYRLVIPLVDCCALQMDVDALLSWCVTNGIELNVRKRKVITLQQQR